MDTARLRQEGLAPFPQLPEQSTPQNYGGQPTLYVIAKPPGSTVYKNYNGNLSIGFGVLNILLVTISIFLNGFAISSQYFGKDNFWIRIFPAAFCGFWIMIAAMLAIASGIQKTKTVITAHLAVSCIGSFCAFGFLGLSLLALGYEIRYPRSEYFIYATAVVWVMCSVCMSITTVWCCALCSSVICHRSSAVTPVITNVEARERNRPVW